MPFAAGENHFTRFEFERLIHQGTVDILQPDICKAGGITETLRIAAMASAHKLPIHCHTVMGIDMVATTHVLSAINNGGYYEADCSVWNPLRDDLVSPPVTVAADGTIRPNDGPGLGIEVNEDLIRRYPGTAGAGYV